MANLDIQIQTQASAALGGVRGLATQLRALQTSATQVNSALNANTAATNANTAAMGRLSSSTRQAHASFNSARSGLESFNRGVSQLKALIAGGIVLKLGTEVTDTALKMRGAENAMTALAGSATLGEAKLKKLEDISAKVGFRNLDLVKSYIKLQGAVAGTTLEGEASDKLFENLARATALYGGSTEELEGSLTALTQMASKGTVQMEELKGQLGDRLPGALRIAADAMGVTTAELSKMVKDGKVDADTFFRKFGDELGRKVPANFESARAGIARFQNTWDKAKVKFAESGFLTGLNDGMTALAATITRLSDDGSLTRLGQALGAVMSFAAEHIGTITLLAGALVGLNVAGSVATSFMALRTALAVVGAGAVTAAGSMTTLAGAMAFLTGPWGIAIMAIAAAVGALALSQQKAIQPTKDVKAATEALDKVVKGYKDSAIAAANATGKEREQLIASLSAKKSAIEHEKALAQAKLTTARATLAAARAEVTSAYTSTWGGAGAASEAANQGRANRGNRVAAQATADVATLEKSVTSAQAAVDDIAATLKSLEAPKVDLGAGGKGDGGKGAKDAAKATKDYEEELRKLKAAADAATLSERDQFAMQALESAGLKQNIAATDARSKAIIAAARAAYDAKKAVEAKKEADELEVELTNRLVQAQNDLLALTNPAAAASKQAIAAANQEYEATVRQIEATEGLTKARADALKAQAAQARDTAIQTANGQAKKNETDFERDVRRDSQDAEIAGRGITNPEEAELERQRVEIERKREDTLRRLAESIDINSAEYKELMEVINKTADKELENLEKQTKQTKIVNTIQQMSDLFGNLFTRPKETMKTFFAQMISQLLQTIVYAKLLGTTLQGAFSAMGGGGGGGIVGTILKGVFGARAYGGPVIGGQPYLVGEKGPEIVIPGRSGTVIPNGNLGGAGGGFSMGDFNTHITVNNSGGMDAKQLSTALVAQNQKMFENIIDRKLKERRLI